MSNIILGLGGLFLFVMGAIHIPKLTPELSLIVGLLTMIWASISFEMRQK